MVGFSWHSPRENEETVKQKYWGVHRLHVRPVLQVYGLDFLKSSRQAFMQLMVAEKSEGSATCICMQGRGSLHKKGLSYA